MACGHFYFKNPLLIGLLQYSNCPQKILLIFIIVGVTNLSFMFWTIKKRIKITFWIFISENVVHHMFMWETRLSYIYFYVLNSFLHTRSIVDAKNRTLLMGLKPYVSRWKYFVLCNPHSGLVLLHRASGDLFWIDTFTIICYIKRQDLIPVTLKEKNKKTHSCSSWVWVVKVPPCSFISGRNICCRSENSSSLLIRSHIDHCNALFSSLNKIVLHHLKSVQNLAASLNQICSVLSPSLIHTYIFTLWVITMFTIFTLSVKTLFILCSAFYECYCKALCFHLWKLLYK